VQAIEHHMEHKGDKHHVQPSVVTITQPTELHTVYTAEEIGQIAECAHSNDLYLHMDGARIANAAASLNCSLREITSDAGVDALSFGGTKNGMLYGDAIVFFNERLGEDFEYTQKNGMQLMSKMWGITAQFEALLSDNYWIRNAEHANEMASYLETQLGDIPDLTITQPVETNAVFSVIETGVEDRDRLIRESIQQRYPFMMYEGQMRWVTSFDTLREDVNEFVRFIKVVIQKCSLIRCHER